MKCGFSPKYVLDEIETYELVAALNYQHYAVKDVWEAARFVGYVVAQVNSKNRIQMDDFLKFYWEEEKDEKVDTSISKEQIAALKAQAQMYLQSENKLIEKR